VDEITGTIQRVAKRQAVRYMQRTDRTLSIINEYAQSILFENERESILDTYACENEPLCGCPTTCYNFRASLFIGNGFATCKPIPFSFFEEG
jgi:hypothetical protein